MERDEQNGMSAEAAAKYIAKVADSRDKKPVRTIGFSYKLVCMLAKLLPVRAVNRLIGMLYAKSERAAAFLPHFTAPASSGAATAIRSCENGNRAGFCRTP